MVPFSANALFMCLCGWSYAFGTEDDLQMGIGQALSGAGIEYKREERLSATDRPDFMVGDVAIEAKVTGPRAAVMRQLARYASYPEVAEIVLVTSRTTHRMPFSLNGKKVMVLRVGGFI